MGVVVRSGAAVDGTAGARGVRGGRRSGGHGISGGVATDVTDGTGSQARDRVLVSGRVERDFRGEARD
jgi:hypothetical protein